MPRASTLRPVKVAAALAALASLSGCECTPDPTRGSLADNVGAAFAPCNQAEIKFLAAKHNVQLAFRPCGNNAFQAAAWSPDGLKLAFQLVFTAYVMDADAETKDTRPIPAPSPVGPMTWLSASRVAVPVVSEDRQGDARLALYDLPPRREPVEPGAPVPPQGAGLVSMLPLPGVHSVLATERGDGTTELLLLARPAEGAPPSVLTVDTATGEVSPALPWLTTPVTTLTYARPQRWVVLGHDGVVTVHDRDTGEEKLRVDNALRGSLHPGGRWLMLEHAGEPQSLYYQRVWDELSDAARTREKARAAHFEATLPDSMEKTVQPPMLSLYDLSTGSRTVLTAFQGDLFHWYEAAEDWGSFFLWGFEGKQFKRNVTLLNLRDRLNAIDEGRRMMGLVPYGSGAGTAPYAPEAADAGSDDAAGAEGAKTDGAAPTAAPAEDAPPDAP